MILILGAVLLAALLPPVVLCAALLVIASLAPSTTAAALRETFAPSDAQPLALAALLPFRAPPA